MSKNGKLIIGLSGKKQSGKNTAANQIALQYFRELGADHPGLYIDDKGNLCGASEIEGSVFDHVAMFAFADEIKRFCIKNLGLARQQCYGTDSQKDTMTHLAWEGLSGEVRRKHAIACYQSGAVYWRLPTGPMTAREVMQVFGTDIMRVWCPDVWINGCLHAVREYPGDMALVTDIRFPNEVAAVKEAGGKVIRLLRDPHATQDRHKSETALDNIPPDTFHLVVSEGLTIEGQGDYLRPIVQQWFTDYGLIERAAP